MNNFLRQRRSLMQMSQAQLADHLGVSQQTVARWETSGQIPVKYLKDLAILMGARVQDFLPRAAGGAAKQGEGNVVPLRAPKAEQGDEDRGLPFGDVHLHFGDETTSFPITWGTLNHIQQVLGDAGLGFAQVAPWVQFETLNNKWVLLNTDHVDGITFIDDDVEAMTHYVHPEVYQAAADLWGRMPTQEEMSKEDFPYSETLVAKVAEEIDRAGDKPWIEFRGVSVKLTSGRCVTQSMNEDIAYALAFLETESVQDGFSPQGFLQLTDRDDGRFEHVRMASVRLIEASLVAYTEANAPDAT